MMMIDSFHEHALTAHVSQSAQSSTSTVAKVVSRLFRTTVGV